MLFASSVSLFGQVSTGMAPTARAVWAMTHEDDDSPQFLPSFVGKNIHSGFVPASFSPIRVLYN